MRILVAEDDETLSRSLKSRLGKEGYAVDSFFDGEEAEDAGTNGDYDAVVLDLGLPKKPGLDVLRSWRKSGMKTPVIILTARGAWSEKVEGFKAGADDYLSKPFHVEELLARLGALIRRAGGVAGGVPISAGGVTLDEERQTAQVENGDPIGLTAMEFRLLRYFILNPGKLITRSALEERAYDFDSEKESNVIEVYIRRLRKKLGEGIIKTRRGQGYVFGVEGE